MFISVIELMQSKAEEKSIIELYANNFYCYSCKKKIDFNPPVEDQNQEEPETIKKSIFCEKCKRIFYCSFDCMKKSKEDHIPICLKYCEYHSDVNEIVERINILKYGENNQE